MKIAKPSISVKQLAEVKNSMNSTERINHYGTRLPQEEDVVGGEETKPASTWPESGEIQFNDVQMRYREGLPLTLKGLDLQVRGGERIGVVGRTGAGKPSIMSCLFRLIELSAGKIEIDCIDISKIGLHRLRRSLSIIPQDLTLFRGTVRSNLDPFNQHSDVKLWHVLQQAYLVPQAEEVSGTSTPSDDTPQPTSTKGPSNNKITLSTPVLEEGHNFSLG